MQKKAAQKREIPQKRGSRVSISEAMARRFLSCQRHFSFTSLMQASTRHLQFVTKLAKATTTSLNIHSFLAFSEFKPLGSASSRNEKLIFRWDSGTNRLSWRSHLLTSISARPSRDAGDSLRRTSFTFSQTQRFYSSARTTARIR